MRNMDKSSLKHRVGPVAGALFFICLTLLAGARAANGDDAQTATVDSGDLKEVRKQIEQKQQEIQKTQQAISQQKQTINQQQQSISQQQQVISTQSTAIQSQKRDLGSLQQQLQKDQAAISQLNQKLSKTQNTLNSTRKQLRTLEQQRRQLDDTLKHQEKLLADQLNHAYRMGEHDYLKLLLNQQDPTDIGRTLEYYGYFNNARLQAISAIKTSRQALERNRQQTAQLSKTLNSQLQDQQSVQQDLQQQQRQRSQTEADIKSELAAREAKLASHQEALKDTQDALKDHQSALADQQTQLADAKTRLAKLKKAEQEMSRQIELARKRLLAERQRKKAEAIAQARAKARTESKAQGRAAAATAAAEDAAEARASAQIALGDHKGIGQERGRLPWPLKGPLVRQFGEHRQGEVSWKGILIGAATGSPVRAIADGDVVFANRLEGFGNVLVVDHGNGYLSLYGNNDSLLKQSGDTVHRGDLLARAGNSGGQTQPGVYFEIRWQGKPVNPVSWLSR